MPNQLETILAFGLAMVAVANAPAWAGSITERVDLGPRGAQANGVSGSASLSADGRLVAFESWATNLVPGDSNGVADIFVRDRRAGTTRRVSVGVSSAQANGESRAPILSADGRYVLFSSFATNLVPADRNGKVDGFVRDRRTGTTELATLGQRGVQGDGDSYIWAISADGRLVAFVSDADNLVPGDTNRAPDIFVRDRQAGTTRRVSVGPGGLQADRGSFSARLSADGRLVAFESEATNLVAGDGNGVMDVFVRDLRAETTSRISIGPRGAEGNGISLYPSISADGRYVAFQSAASNLVPVDKNGDWDVFVHDRATTTTVRASLGPPGVRGNAMSGMPAISASGRLVAFESWATNLVPGDTNRQPDIFVRDLRAGITERASLGVGGAQGNSLSLYPAISADGAVVAFESRASNLVPDDTNYTLDVFVRVAR